MMSATDYEALASVVANDRFPVTKYRSKKSGLQVCIAEVDGPLVDGYFCLATEAFDDDGLPHTLEHLIFLGSDKYPFKGVLDLVANRCLASGTNAWTDTDHTCYTVNTAGAEGFLQIMPIYIDHILHPTLTDSGFTTEVHHVNGEGEDAGVVYCEMQGRENMGESLTHLSMLRAMYPGHCGYKSETGGIMANLRTSTTNAKVRDYHKTFYRPENLCLIISGKVDAEQVFQALKPVEDKISQKGYNEPYTRPWQSDVPPLTEPLTEHIVKYPSDSEEHGMVSLAWRGPKAKEQYKMTALMILLEYLTDTSIAPLQKSFVEIDDPYCSRVRYSIIENAESCFYVSFENVPKEKLKAIRDRLTGILESLSSGQEPFDMSRMDSVIHRRILESLDHLERQPNETMAFNCIGDFLYGYTQADFSERFNQISSFRDLRKKDATYWQNLLKAYMVGTPTVSILGEPSTAYMEELAREEKERIAEQRRRLGENGLAEKARLLEKATETNDIPPPEEMISSVPVPDVSRINFHPVSPTSNQDMTKANQNEKFPLAALPVRFQLDDMATQFVQISVMMNTDGLSKQQRLYLPLYLEVMLESPILRNGVVVPHHEVIAGLAKDTLSVGAGAGVGGGRFTAGDFAQVASLNIRVELEKYERGVEWLHELLYKVEFDPERIKIMANKMNNDVSRVKRKGNAVVQSALKNVVFENESNHWATSVMRQHKFLDQVLETLERKPQEVVNSLRQLQMLLTKPGNLRIHMAADVKKLSSLVAPQAPWKQFIPKDRMEENKATLDVVPSYQLLETGADRPTAVILGVGSVESNYLIQVGPCVNSYTHSDLAAIKVYIQYLTQLEGPMWKQIRGLGLSYHFSMNVKPETGLIYFVLFKSTQLVDAYRVGKEIVDGYLSHEVEFNEIELETSKSSLIFEIIEREKTVADASHQSLLSYFRQVDKDYNRNLLQEVSSVTRDDLDRVGSQYFLPLFDPNKSRVAVCCHPSKVSAIKTEFKEKFGRDLTVVESLDDGLLADY